MILKTQNVADMKRTPLSSIVTLATLLLPLVSAIDAECSACEAVAAELQQRLDAEIPRNLLDMRHRLDKDGNRYGKIINYKVSEMRAVDLLEDLCSTMDSYTIIAEEPEAKVPSSTAEAAEASSTAAGSAAAEQLPAGQQQESSGEEQQQVSSGDRQQKKAKKRKGQSAPELVWVKYNGAGSINVDKAKRPIRHEEEQRQKQLTTFCGLLIERHEDDVIDALTSDKFQNGVAPVLCQEISSKCKGKQYPKLEAPNDSYIGEQQPEVDVSSSADVKEL